MKNLHTDACAHFCSQCIQQNCDECPLHALLEEHDRYESIRQSMARVPYRKHASENECRCGAASGSHLCEACEKVLVCQLLDERVVKSLVQEQLQSICDLLGVEDPLKGVEATLEKFARLKAAVNNFPLGLLMSGKNEAGETEHRFVNLLTQRTSPAYPDTVRAILAGHEFYKENPGLILEVHSIGVQLPGPVDPGDCDG